MGSSVGRIQWIDYLKGLCMVSIVMNHLAWPEWYGRFLYPFQLAGFFFVSGYTFNLKTSFREFLVVKVRTLLIPVLIFGLINTIITYIYPGTVLKERLIGLVLQIPGKWDDLWFVACLFSMSLIFYPIAKYVKSNIFRLIIVVCLAVASSLYALNFGVNIPWHIENACILLPFMFLGYVAKRTDLGEFMLGKLRDLKVLIPILLLYILLIGLWRNYPIDVHVLNYGNFPLFIVSALLGTALIVAMSMRLERWADVRVVRWLQYVGKNTLIYYAFQSKVITALVAVLAVFQISSSTCLVNLLAAMLVCVALIVPVELINRFCPSIIGRQSIYK